MKLIYIPVELKYRELMNKLFFVANNIDEDFVFFIGDKTSVNRAVRLLGKGVYFYKSINYYDTDHINRVKNRGNVYVSLDEEGGATLNNSKVFQSFLKYRSSQKNMTLVDRIFTWGDFDHKGWQKKYTKFKHKIIKTGATRVDVWRKTIYPKIFKDEIKSLKKYSPYFFIPNSFYTSNDHLNKAIEVDKKLDPKTTSIPLKRRIEEKKNSYKTFLQLVSLTNKLAKDFPKHKIIIKPHPADNIENIKKKFIYKGKSNILVENNFDLTSYIAGSDCVIYNESTTGIQSMVMGKKTICYKFKKNKKSLREFANNCAPQAKNYKTLINFINKKNYNKLQNKYLKKIKKRFYISKENSSKIIMNDIKKIKKENTNLNKLKHRVRLFGLYFLLKDIAYSLLTYIKKVTSKVEIDWKSHLIKMPGGIKRKEVENIFEKLDLEKKIKIMNFGKNGYLIYKNNAKKN